VASGQSWTLHWGTLSWFWAAARIVFPMGNLMHSAGPVRVQCLCARDLLLVLRPLGRKPASELYTGPFGLCCTVGPFY